MMTEEFLIFLHIERLFFTETVDRVVLRNMKITDEEIFIARYNEVLCWECC